MIKFAIASWAVALVLAASAVRAEPTTSSKAAAEMLFQQGAELVQQQKFALACEKFEASQKLDPALGTMLRWADCLDRAGKSASAWALFGEAAAIAKGRGETERERIAEQRAGFLKDNLALLNLKSSAKVLPKDLIVQINGAAIPRESLNTPLPVDPGETVIEVSAPGYKSWSGKLKVSPGPSQQELVFPALVREPRAKTPLARQAQRTKVVERDAVYRTVGLVTGGVGLLGLGASGVLGWRAGELGSQSRSHCQQADPNACDDTGYELRKDALLFADAATISGAVGGALVLTGLGLIVFAPKQESELRAAAAPGQAGLELRGRF
jgi:hypothetical protein